MEEITIEQIAKENDPQWNEDKLLEELLELAEVLIKRKNKKGSPKEPTEDMLIEELGDTLMRMDMFVSTLPVRINKKVMDRWDFKEEKMIKAFNEGKYKGKI